MPGHDHHTQGSSISGLFAAGQCMKPGSLKQHLVAFQTLCRSSALQSPAFSDLPNDKPREPTVDLGAKLRSRGGEHLAAVAEAVGCEVQDGHDQGAVTPGQQAIPDWKDRPQPLTPHLGLTCRAAAELAGHCSVWLASVSLCWLRQCMQAQSHDQQQSGSAWLSASAATRTLR